MRKLFVAVAVCLVCAPTAHAAFPGQNGQIAFEHNAAIHKVNADGTGLSPLGPGLDPAWSPDGTKIAFSDGADIHVMDADGSDRQLVADSGSSGAGFRKPGWSPDGTRIAFRRGLCDADICLITLAIANADGSGHAHFPTGTCNASAPDWSPDGTRIAFWNEWIDFGCNGDDVDIFTIRTDGTDLLQVTFDGDLNAANRDPSWSPDGQRILFRRVGEGLLTVKPDGSARTPLAGDEGVTGRARWSPDGSKIVFPRVDGDDAYLWVMNSDGTGGAPAFQTTGPPISIRDPDWQPVPVNGYPRPKGATPLQVYLVPAYEQCLSPTRTHGPPLAFPSCHPPAQESGALTVGTADANGKPAKSVSVVRFDTLPGNPATAADEADVQVSASITDVYEQGTLADYAGDLQATVGLRITDKLNAPHPGGPGAGTVSDTSLEFAVPCAPTPDTTVGATCALSTTVDALAPGAVAEGRRAVWALGQIGVADADGAPFLRQGIFIP